MDYTGRTVIITGAGSGIGEVAATRFAALGAHVIVADIQGAEAERVARDLASAIAVTVDIRERDQVDAMVRAAIEAFGRVDVLINNAMACSETPFLDATVEEFRRDIDVNLLGTMLCSQAVLPGMIAQKGGVILNIASVNGLAYFGNEAYSAAKAGVISLTKAIASQFGTHGIRCNVVAPGTIATPYWQARSEADPDVMTKAAQWYPLGRVGTPDDVVEALVFLASDAAPWISGAMLPIDGGLMTGNLAMARTISQSIE